MSAILISKYRPRVSPMKRGTVILNKKKRANPILGLKLASFSSSSLSLCPTQSCIYVCVEKRETTLLAVFSILVRVSPISLIFPFFPSRMEERVFCSVFCSLLSFSSAATSQLPLEIESCFSFSRSSAGRLKLASRDQFPPSFSFWLHS